MFKRFVPGFSPAWLILASVVSVNTAEAGLPRPEADNYSAWRAAAARTLEARGDAPSLATAAALTFVGAPSRSKADTARAAAAALNVAMKASELEPNDPLAAWLRLKLCSDAPGCDIRDAATTLRWVDADNGAAWLPTLAGAQRDRDTLQVDRILAAMAEGTRFDLYGNRAAVMMFDALKRIRTQLPAHYLKSDLTRLTEAMDIAAAAVIPSFSPVINACREAATMERREACLQLSKTMQKADAVMAQLVGFAIEKRLMPADSKEVRLIAERRRLLEWRASAANFSDTPLLPWLRNARARSRLAKMRAMPREEDVYIALLKEHGIPLDPPQERR
ncbi:MAG TPA: hypothetical protein VKP66_17250 [Steroidobacteraceae bacterium]|nr:hypothetical protein [Steroidobacteraceae bacterium]